MYIIFPVKIMSDVNVSIQKKIEYMYAIVTMKRIFVEEKSRKYIALDESVQYERNKRTEVILSCMYEIQIYNKNNRSMYV